MHKGLVLLLVILLVVTNVNIGETSAIPLPSTWEDSQFQYQPLASFSAGPTPPVVTLMPGMRFGRSTGAGTGVNAGQIMTTPLTLTIDVNQMGPFLPNRQSHFTGYIWFGNVLTQFNTSLILPTSPGSFNLTWVSPISMPAGTSYELIWQVNELNHGNPSARVTWSSTAHSWTYSQFLHHKSVGSATNLVAMPLNTNPIMPVNIGINDAIVIEYVGFSSIAVRQLGGAWLTNLPSAALSPHPQRITIPQSAFVWTNNQITLQTSTGHIRIIRGGSTLTTDFAAGIDGSTHERTMTVFGSHSNRTNEQLQLRLTHPLSGGVRIMNIASVLTSTWSHTFTHLSHGFYNLEIGFDNGGIFQSQRQIAYYVNAPAGGSLQSGIITTPSPNQIIYDNKVRVTGSVANIPSEHSVRVILADKGTAANQIQILPHGATTFDLEFMDVAEGSYSILVESFQGVNFRLLTSHSIIVASSTLAPPTVDPNAGVLEQIRQSVEVVLWWLMSPFRTIGDVGRVIISTIENSYQDGIGTFVSMMGIFYSVMPEPMANAITILVNVTVLVTVIKLVRG